MLYTIGIDEVGRGALAGPVVVAVVALPRNFQFSILNSQNSKLRDSKKLSPKQREIWSRRVKENPFILYAVSRVYPKKIDSINISKAANLAATRAFNRLTKNSKLKTKNCKTFLDGGLYLSKSLNSHAYPACRQAGGKADKSYILNSIIKGDEKINAIKIASIVAKVTRDRYMVKLHKIYPCYGFDTHKGYGTKYHRAAIRKHGHSDVHRRSFKVKK